jgi:hypothetical protein
VIRNYVGNQQPCRSMQNTSSVANKISLL